jgi:signal transduction histidine kinase
MATVEERRTQVLTLFRSVRRSARLAAGYINTLLEETGNSLGREQSADLVRIRTAAEGILDLARMATEEVGARDHQLHNQADFDRFFRVTFHDLRAQISLIIGFSRVALDEITGPLSTEQKEVLVQVEALGRMLASTVTECQEAIWGTESESGADPPAQ